MSNEARWNAYKIKYALNDHDIYNSYFKKNGSRFNSGKDENQIVNADTVIGYPTNDIEYQVPVGFEFHFLSFNIDTILENNDIIVRLYWDAILKWTHEFSELTEEKEVCLPFDEPAPENSNIIWTAQNISTAPARLVNVEFFGILKKLKAA